MSEKVYACLLRLYPSAFRARYREEALQLCHDRLRAEPGLFRRYQLYCDFLFDALGALPQAWRNSYPAASALPLIANAENTPCFRLLDSNPLRPTSFLLASTLAFAALSIFGLLLSLPSPFLPLSASRKSLSPIESVLKRLNDAATPGSNDLLTSSNTSAGATAPRTEAPMGNAAAISANSKATLSDAERDHVVQSVARILVAHYIDHQKAIRVSNLILSRERGGEYDAARDGATFAKRLTQDVQNSTTDSHLVVQYRRIPIPTSQPNPSSGHMGIVYWIDKHFSVTVPEARKPSAYGNPDILQQTPHLAGQPSRT